MDKINHALDEFREMDALAAQDSPSHRMHPLVKLLITLAYILCVVSFHKYQLSALAVMVLFPILMFQLSGIPVRTCFYKLRIVLPLVCAVGLLNPFYDRAPLLQLGNITVSGGVVSMIRVTSLTKPMLSISSASSRTMVCTASSRMLPRCIWSSRRPGVATTICGFFFSAEICRAKG